MERLQKVEADIQPGLTTQISGLNELGSNNTRDILAAVREGDAAISKKLQSVRNHIRLSEQEIAVQTVFGFYLVVPPYNLDVSVGILRDGIIEPWTTNLVMHLLKPGMTYLNVGANFGYYAALGASLVETQGRVMAVEANPYVFCHLVKSMHWAGCSGIVSTFNFAAHDVNEEKMRFNFDPQFMGGGSVFAASGPARPSFTDCVWNGNNIRESLDETGKFITKGHYLAVETEGRTLDAAFAGLKRIDLLHMDIEGSEPKAILGAREIIRKNREISILTEWWDGRVNMPGFAEDIREMLGFLESGGFIPHRIEPEKFMGLGTPPGLKKLRYEDLATAGHCDILFTRNPDPVAQSL